MEPGYEKTLSTAASAAELVADADDALHRANDRERDAEDFDQVKQSLNDAENADMSKGRDLDGQRVGEIRSLLAQGGDNAVAKKFGESALGSPEAVKAKAQRAAIRKHESEMAMDAIGTAAIEKEQKTVTAAQQLSATPMRDHAIARELGKNQERSRGDQRGEQPAPTAALTGQVSRTPMRDQAIVRELRREQDRDRSRDSLGR